jgi:hypothetical protein
MNQLLTLLTLITLATSGCAALNHGRSMSAGQVLSLAQSSLPSPDGGQAYGVQFKDGIWLITLNSASFSTNGTQEKIVAKVTDRDAKIEVVKNPPQSSAEKQKS